MFNTFSLFTEQEAVLHRFHLPGRAGQGSPADSYRHLRRAELQSSLRSSGGQEPSIVISDQRQPR